ncbi:MAG: alpha/beta hydrolase [FCB group bacterium]|jgi:acetyl esterase/lipase|nr:alpha/beta hydrolase [FCB group bacterium]
MHFKIVIAVALLAAAGAEASQKQYRTETVVYASPGGKDLKATVYFPVAEAKEPRPAIVLIHGGAWVTGSRRQLYWYGRRFAEAGYVAMSVSYRTMPGASFPAPLHDVKSAVRWLRKNAEPYSIDPGRIATLGTSAGGHLALMLALTASEKDLEGEENSGFRSDVQAAVSLYGPADLRSFVAEKEKGRIARYTWGPYVKDFAGKEILGGKDPLDAASPVAYVGQDTPPILCVHGTNDTLVPIEQSREMFKKLKEAGLPAQCIEVPGYRHAFDHLHPSVRRELFPKILKFLNDHLEESGEQSGGK